MPQWKIIQRSLRRIEKHRLTEKSHFFGRCERLPVPPAGRFTDAQAQAQFEMIWNAGTVFVSPLWEYTKKSNTQGSTQTAKRAVFLWNQMAPRSRNRSKVQRFAAFSPSDPEQPCPGKGVRLRQPEIHRISGCGNRNRFCDLTHGKILSFSGIIGYDVYCDEVISF